VCPDKRPSPEPFWRRRNGFDEILDAHDDHGGFSAPVYDKALIVLDGAGHNLPELRAGDMGIDAAFHKNLQSID